MPRSARRARDSSAKQNAFVRAPRLGRTEANPLIGQRVRHATYGAGTITGVEGEGDRKLTVRFSDHGTKKLMERYANLSWA